MAKTFSIILALFVLTFIMVAMYCALTLASRFDERTDEQIKKDIKKLLSKKQLCLKCKIGKECYKQNEHTKVCPHIHQQNDDSCDFFVPCNDTQIKSNSKK